MFHVKLFPLEKKILVYGQTLDTKIREPKLDLAWPRLKNVSCETTSIHNFQQLWKTCVKCGRYMHGRKRPMFHVKHMGIKKPGSKSLVCLMCFIVADESASPQL